MQLLLWNKCWLVLVERLNMVSPKTLNYQRHVRCVIIIFARWPTNLVPLRPQYKLLVLFSTFIRMGTARAVRELLLYPVVLNYFFACEHNVSYYIVSNVPCVHHSYALCV